MISTQQLRSIALLSELDDTQLERMAKSGRRRELGGDQLLFQHGDDACYFYLVESGRVKLSRLAPNGQEKVIEILGPGQMFAEAVMFFSVPKYPVDATAVEPSVVLGLDGHVFVEILKQSPDSALRLMGTLSMRLHQRVNEIDALTLQNAALRVIHYLLQHVKEEEGISVVELEAAKKLVAARLSLQPETFSRVLNQLQRKNAILVQGATIVIEDLDLLRQLALDG